MALVNPVAEKMYARGFADHDTPVRVGVGVIILNGEGWILLEKRSDCGLWGLPGGRIEPGESITEAAVREVKEETGLDVDVIRLLGVYSEPAHRIITFPDNGDVVHIIDILIEAAMVAGELSCSSESEELRFFEPRALPRDTDIAPPARAPLQDFFTGLTGAIR